MAKIIWGYSTPIRRRNKGVIFLLFAAALMVGALGPQRALACDVTDVDLWIGDTSSHAQEGNTDDVYKCPDCYFGWYVEWDADPGYGDFYGEIWLASTLVDTFTEGSSGDWEAAGTAMVPGNMSCGPKTVKAWMRRVGGDWCPSNTRTLVVTEIEDVTAGTKHATETLYRAQDYLDEPSERQTLTQGVTAELSAVITPDCFYWVPDCDEYLPTICPDDGCVATFSAKDHDLYSIGAVCGNSSKTMSIALEGIDIYTYISSEDEMTKTYNIFLNENFNQEREATTLPGHKQCYYVDNSDDSLTSPNIDNPLEIGAISLYAAIYGDTDATVRFNSSGIKLYDSSQEHNKLEFGTEYNIMDIGGSICVEGISTGTKTLSATIETQDGYTTTDQLKIKVIPINLVAVDPAPSSDQHEICHKEKLLIRVNNNDSDNDGIVDWQDDYIAGGDPDLAHIILEKPTGAEESDLGGGEIWLSTPSYLSAYHNPNKTGGESPYSYSLSDLPKDIYLEAYNPGGDILDTSVTANTFLDSGVECHDDIRYTVIKVDIENPKGSLDAVKNPEASWLWSPCYHFDFQGVRSTLSTAERPYVLGINGDIKPTPSVSYKWTLDAAAGTLSDDTIATPEHTAPATEGQGMLTLKAMFDTTYTGLKEERKVKIYKDHLARDYANFGTGGYCINWEITTFNVDPHPPMFDWNCHGATVHAYNGTYSGSHTGQPWLSWDVKTVVVTEHDSSGNGSHPSLGALGRGDVVAYFSPNGKPYDPPNIGDLSIWIMQHSQTCTGSGDETYGANNEPLQFPGDVETWKWATSPAGDWGIHIWKPSLQGTYVPIIIVVFGKP